MSQSLSPFWHPYNPQENECLDCADKVLADEEHNCGARLTLASGFTFPFSITCSIYQHLIMALDAPTRDEAGKKYHLLKLYLSAALLHLHEAKQKTNDEDAGIWLSQIQEFLQSL